MTAGSTAGSDTQVWLMGSDYRHGTLPLFTVPGVSLNGLAFNPQDRFLYAVNDHVDKAELRRDTSAQNPRQLVSMLLAGRIDIIVGDREQLLYFVREQRADAEVRILPTPLVQMSRYVAFAKGDKHRAERFARALEKLRADGRLRQRGPDADGDNHRQQPQ